MVTTFSVFLGFSGFFYVLSCVFFGRGLCTLLSTGQGRIFSCVPATVYGSYKFPNSFDKWHEEKLWKKNNFKINIITLFNTKYTVNIYILKFIDLFLWLGFEISKLGYLVTFGIMDKICGNPYLTNFFGFFYKRTHKKNLQIPH